MRRFFPLVLALVVVTPLLAGCATPAESGSVRTDVVTTIYPVHFLAARLAGENLTVASVLPLGVNPHAFEPAPRDVARILEARVLVVNGAGMEPWLGRVIPELRKDADTQVVVATEDAYLVARGGHVHADGTVHGGRGAQDPHAWLDPLRALAMVRTIRDAFVRADPGNAEHYYARAATLESNLDALHERFSLGLRQCQSRHVIVSHDAFGYLGKRYDVYPHAVMGLNAKSEPAPERVRDLVDVAREFNVTTVFYETLADPRVAQVIAEEANLTVGVLSTVEGLTAEDRARGRNYFTIMDENLAALRKAMRCV